MPDSLDVLIADVAAADADANGVAALAGRGVGGRSAGRRALALQGVLESLREGSPSLGRVQLCAVKLRQFVLLLPCKTVPSVE